MPLPTMQLRRKPLNLEVMDEVVFIHEIPYCPQQAVGSYFGLRFQPKLCLPLLAGSIFDIELGTMPLLVFGDELHGELGPVLFSAGSVQQVLRTDITGVAPYDPSTRRIRLLNGVSQRKEYEEGQQC